MRMTEQQYYCAITTIIQGVTTRISESLSHSRLVALPARGACDWSAPTKRMHAMLETTSTHRLPGKAVIVVSDNNYARQRDRYGKNPEAYRAQAEPR